MPRQRRRVPEHSPWGYTAGVCCGRGRARNRQIGTAVAINQPIRGAWSQRRYRSDDSRSVVRLHVDLAWGGAKDLCGQARM